MINKTKKTYLIHHGVKGQKWGVRRYQNKDGSLTDYGKKHYGLDKLDSSNRKDIQGLSEKEKMNALRNERINLHRQVENKNLTNESGLYDEAARIHNEKVKKGLIDNNPDEEWDLDYLLDQLDKIDVIQEKAHKEVDKYLEDKYQMKMSDFEAAEKKRIESGEKKIQNFEKGIMALSVTAMLSLIALDALQR